MNTHHHLHAWSIALAAFVLAVLPGCGTEVAVTPADIGGPVESSKPAPPEYRGGEPLSDLPQRGLGAEGWR